MILLSSTGSFDYSVRKSSFSGSTSNNADSGPMNVYMVYLNDYVNRRSWSSRGQVTFEHEILGIWTEWENTILKSGFSPKVSLTHYRTSTKRTYLLIRARYRREKIGK